MKFNTRSLIEGLSYTLDIAEKAYFSHSKHVAYLSMMIAKELALTLEIKQDLYYAALLHDIGASNTYLVGEHCIIGKEIVLKLPINNIIAEYIYYHHEHFDGTGPFALKGDEIPIPAQIICFADLFDKRFRGATAVNLDLIKEINLWVNINKDLFNPKILTAFNNIIKREYLLLDYFSHEFNSVLFRRVDVISTPLDFNDVKLFAHAFSEIIDNRSHFTFRHSLGVANLVNKVTLALGYNEDIQSEMYIAALLHDIGKLLVSNEIIEKNGKLTDEERYEINKHTYYTRWVLEQIDGFEDITNYASNHHEKLNGSGYPLHLYGNQIKELERIMAICDIYQALTEDRPYRSPMHLDKVWSIIDGMVDSNELDKTLVEQVKVILQK